MKECAKLSISLFPGKGLGPGFSLCWSGLWPSPPTPCSWRVGGFVHVFSRIPRLWGLSGGPVCTLFHVVPIIWGPVLFAVFAPLLVQGAGEPYFTGRGGPFLHAPARTNYRSRSKVCAWRAFLRGRWGAVFYQALAASGKEGHFTRYFT